MLVEDGQRERAASRRVKVLALAPEFRVVLALALGLSGLGTTLVIGQMFLLSSLMSELFLRHAGLERLASLFGWLLACSGAQTVLIWAREICLRLGSIRARRNVRRRVFAHLLHLGPCQVQNERSGELVATLSEGIEGLDPYLARYLPQMALSVVVPLMLLLVIFPVDALSALLLALTAPLIPLLMMLIGLQAEKQSQRQWKALLHMSAHFLDVVQGLSTLKLLGRSRDEEERVARISEALREKTMSTLRLAFLSGAVLEFMTSMAIGLIAVVLGVRLLSHQLSLQVALFVLLLVPEFYRPLRDLGAARHAALEGRASAQRLHELLATPAPASVVNSPDSFHPICQPGGELKPELAPGPLEVAFQRVSYTYPGNARAVLREITLTLPAGTCTALVGRSGAGKSTLARLLLRLLEAEQGTITINGQLLSGMTPAQWWKAVAWVPQRPYLFHGSVGENIRLARPEASEEEVREAARLAGALTWIESLPRGFATQVGEQGARLSAGQVQRIALARAFLKNAPLLILDEPTANLDSASELIIRQALTRLVQGRTVLVIAHRPSTIAAASRVLVLEDGRLADAGPPSAWLAGRPDLLAAVASTASACSPTEAPWSGKVTDIEIRRSEAVLSQGTLMHSDAGRTGEQRPAPAEMARSSRVFRRLLKMQLHVSGPALLAALLGCVLVASNLGLLSLAIYLISASSVVSLLALLTIPIFFVRLLGLVRPLARYGERCISHDVTFRLLTRLRRRVYACLEPLTPALQLGYRSGDVLARLLADVDELQHLYLHLLAPLLVAGGISLLTFLVLAQWSLRLALSGLIFLLLAWAGVPLLCWWLARDLGEGQLTWRAELKAVLLDGLQGMTDLLIYGQAVAYQQKIAALEARLGGLQMRQSWLAGLQEALSELLKQGAVWTLLWLAVPLVNNGQLDGIYPGCLALALLASFEIVGPLGQFCQFFTRIRAAGRRLFALLDAPPVVTDPAQPVRLPALRPEQGCELVFEHVSFAYEKGSAPVLRDFNLRVRAGRKIALMGSSGVGKSTLLRLALRVWDVDDGRITLNGEDVRRYALADLRALMSCVTQDTYLFNASLRENLLLARPQASEAELLAALEQARLGEYVRHLPAGLDTHIGEQGVRLSGGERQRLAIARALLKDAPLLLLDEVTANLDPQTEREVLTALHALMQGRTVLMVTHQSVGMEYMDEIIVLKDTSVSPGGSLCCGSQTAPVSGQET